jgi:multidrug efflux pump subunit AcrB
LKNLEIKNENIAGTLAKTFIKHPLTLILGIFILAVGYLSLVMTPREENPQIKVAGGAVIVPMPGAKASEIQKIIIEPLERKIREIKGVEHVYSVAQDSVGIVQVQYYIGHDIQNKKIALLSAKVNESTELSEIPQTTMTISKLKGANTVVINNKIFAYLESVKPTLEKEGIKYVITRDDGFTANHAVNELVSHLLISVVIIAILLVFTLGLREAIIVSLTVPMILSLTLFVGFLMGETINRITLFALLLSLGLLVDAAIIVIENIHRHMHDHHSKDKDLTTISIEATNEIGNPTNMATIAIILTFVPMFFVGGMMGQFMHPLPVFVPISLFMSLVVAYIFTPYLVRKLLKKSH